MNANRAAKAVCWCTYCDLSAWTAFLVKGRWSRSEIRLDASHATVNIQCSAVEALAWIRQSRAESNTFDFVHPPYIRTVICIQLFLLSELKADVLLLGSNHNIAISTEVFGERSSAHDDQDGLHGLHGSQREFSGVQWWRLTQTGFGVTRVEALKFDL